MLCCWLQQLQEFGGPEVDKPDLLKGSIGSLKNIGLVNNTSSATSTTTSTAPAVTSTVTTTSNIKANVSTSGSIIKHNPCLDKRARYNVCIYITLRTNNSNSHCAIRWRTFCLTVVTFTLVFVSFANAHFLNIMFVLYVCVCVDSVVKAWKKRKYTNIFSIDVVHEIDGGRS